MKLADHIQAYKAKHRNTYEHTFQDGTIFKGNGQIKMHEFLDNLYKDCVTEFKTTGTKYKINLINSLLKV
jgi:hypothetical protein